MYVLFSILATSGHRVGIYHESDKYNLVVKVDVKGTKVFLLPAESN
jgi:hypothetical protein